MATIADRIRGLRERKNLSLQQVAEGAGVTKPHLWQIESGKATNPTLEFMTKLSNYFDVSVSYLSGDNTKTKQLPEKISVLFRDAEILEDDDLETLSIVVAAMVKKQKAKS